MFHNLRVKEFIKYLCSGSILLCWIRGFFFRRVLCRFSGLSPFFFCRYGFGQSSIRSTTLITNELFSVLETLSGPGTRPTLVILGMLFKNFLWTRTKPFISYRPPPIYRIPQLGRKYSWKLYLRSKAFRALPDMSYAVLPFSMQNTAHSVEIQLFFSTKKSSRFFS